MPLLLVIAVGGALGSLARFAVAEVLGAWDAQSLPWATLTVNVVGCLLIGLVAARTAASPRPWLRPLVVTGILGGFTTVSAFALETGVLIDAGHVGTAVGYVLVTLVAGLLAVRLGTAIVGRATQGRTA